MGEEENEEEDDEDFDWEDETKGNATNFHPQYLWQLRFLAGLSTVSTMAFETMLFGAKFKVIYHGSLFKDVLFCLKINRLVS